jgi:hypothetical protein
MTVLLVAIPISAAQATQDSAAAPGQQPEPADAEERLDDGLKRFGYLAGLARVCVATSQQTALDREVIDLHASIGRLFGTDRAFLFGSAFGYGTSVKVETADCAEILKTYEARVAKHRSAAGKSQ